MAGFQRCANGIRMRVGAKIGTVHLVDDLTE
jgi:hypothetical protein